MIPQPSASVVFLVFLDGELVQAPEHVGVGYLIAALRRDGFNVTVLEVGVTTEVQSLTALARLSPALVGLSLTMAGALRASRIGAQLRNVLGEAAHITAGGPLATFLGTRLLEKPQWSFLDSVICGDGEIPIVELAAVVARGGSLRLVHSLSYRTSSGLVANALAPPIEDLDALPWPARDQIASRRFPVARISTSRGCTSRCTFCNAPHAGNTRGSRVWRGRSPDNVVGEIEELHRKSGIDEFEFVDSTFEDPGGTMPAKRRIARIAELILERGLRICWSCCMQAQNWTNADHDLLRLLFLSGLERVLVGIETGSAKSLALWKKRATVQDNLRIVPLLRVHRIHVALGFIMFHPEVDADEIHANTNFLSDAAGWILRNYCTKLQLYPGAEIVEVLRKQGLLKNDYDSDLNPYGYGFRSPEMESLATAMGGIAGDERVRGAREKPTYVSFERRDAEFDGLVAHSLRRHGPESPHSNDIRELDETAAELRREITLYNVSLFQAVWEQVRESRCPSEIALAFLNDVSHRYSDWVKRLEDLHRNVGRAAVGVVPPACTESSSAIGGARL